MKNRIATMLGLLLLTSCADPYQARREQLGAYMITIQSGLERSGWSHEDAAKAAGVEGWKYAQQLNAADLQRQQKAAIMAAQIGSGLQSAGDSIARSQTDPFILYKMNANRQPAMDSACQVDRSGCRTACRVNRSASRQ